MKISFNLAKYALLATVILGFASCGSNDKKDDKNGNVTTKSSTGQLQIRYIDEDSLLAQYNLAKDINEAMLRRSNQFDAAQQQRSAEIQKFGSEVQRKYQSNGYLSEASFNADQAKLQKMQVDAQNYIGRLQRDIQNEMNQNHLQLNDSIDNYLKIYCKQKGYDIVLRKSAAFFIEPKLEVTSDVVEGLNKRYNKVEKK